MTDKEKYQIENPDREERIKELEEALKIAIDFCDQVLVQLYPQDKAIVGAWINHTKSLLTPKP